MPLGKNIAVRLRSRSSRRHAWKWRRNACIIFILTGNIFAWCWIRSAYFPQETNFCDTVSLFLQFVLFSKDVWVVVTTCTCRLGSILLYATACGYGMHRQLYRTLLLIKFIQGKYCPGCYMDCRKCWHIVLLCVTSCSVFIVCLPRRVVVVKASPHQTQQPQKRYPMPSSAPVWACHVTPKLALRDLRLPVFLPGQPCPRALNLAAPRESPYIYLTGVLITS